MEVGKRIKLNSVKPTHYIHGLTPRFHDFFYDSFSLLQRLRNLATISLHVKGTYLCSLQQVWWQISSSIFTGYSRKNHVAIIRNWRRIHSSWKCRCKKKYVLKIKSSIFLCRAVKWLELWKMYKKPAGSAKKVTQSAQKGQKHRCQPQKKRVPFMI